MSRPNLSIEYLSPEELRPSPRNARTHSKKQKALIAESIRRFGMVTPVGVGPDNDLVYGHARVEAAKLAGLEAVPVVRLDHLTAEERRAYLLADNRLALDSGWDRELLALELRELDALDFHLPSLGFSLPEIDNLYEDFDNSRVDGSDAPDDELPDPSDLTVTMDGEMWLMEQHRLLSGDARDQAVYDRLLGSETIDVVFADPPYNVKIENNVSGLGKVRHGDFAMASGEMSQEDFAQFLEQSLQPAADRMRDGEIAFVCMDWRHMAELQTAGLRVFDELKNVCIWNKRNAGMAAFYRSKYEMIFVFKRGTAPHINTFGLGGEGRHRSNVWDYAGVSGISRTGRDELAMHPTVKPIAMIVDALKDVSARGAVVLDNFGGSGSTLIAAEKCGRRARLIEYDKRYCDTIVKRWQTYSLSSAYDRDVWGTNMKRFQRVRDQLRSGELEFQFLDGAQLLKHAFGLVTAARRRKLTPALFYIYAEPAMRGDKAIDPEMIQSHRREAELFLSSIEGDEVRFSHASYRDWLGSWDQSIAALMDHRDLVLKRFDP